MMDIRTALDDLISIIHSDQISSAARTTIRGFTQSRKITLQDVLLFYIFRYGETTNKDMAAYFSKLSRPRASKQAMPYMRDDDQHRSEFGDPPVVVNCFYHEEVKKSAKKKQN